MAPSAPTPQAPAPPPSGPMSPGAPGVGGPGGPTTPGPWTPGAPTTPTGASGSAAHSAWQVWWSFNSDPYLALRARLAGLDAVSGTGDAGVAPTREQIEKEVLPALYSVLGTRLDGPVLRATLLSAARIEEDLGKPLPGTSVDFIARHYLTLDYQDAVDASCVALGVRGGPGALDALLSLVANDEAGRKLRGTDWVDPRTRTFAAYGIGLYARHVDDPATLARIGETLARVLIEDETATYEMHAAAMIAMSLAPSKECAPGEHVDGHVCRGMQIGCMLNYLRDRERPTGLRAHAAPVVARLCQGADPEFEETVASYLLEAIDPRSKEDPEVVQGCVIGLGHLLDGDKDKLDRSIRSALEKIIVKGEELDRRLAVVSLAIGSARPGTDGDASAVDDTRAFLMSQLVRGRKGIDAWAALGLGLLEHHVVNDAHGSIEDDVVRALEASIEKARTADKAGAACLGLGILRRQEAGETVLDLHEASDNDDVRGWSALALGLMGVQEAAETLRAGLTSEETGPSQLYGAALGLRLLGDRDVAPLLLERLAAAKESEERQRIVAALGLLGDRRTVGPLLALLADEDGDSDVRAAAASAIGTMCDEENGSWAGPIANHLNYGALTWTLVDPFGEGTGLLDMR